METAMRQVRQPFPWSTACTPKAQSGSRLCDGLTPQCWGGEPPPTRPLVAVIQGCRPGPAGHSCLASFHTALS